MSPSLRASTWMLGCMPGVLGSVGLSALWLWQTRVLPGIVSQQPGQGSWELIELTTHQPAWRVLTALVAGLCLLAAALWALSMWLDPRSHARAALAWPLRSWRLAVGAGLLTVLALWLDDRWPQTGIALALLVMLAFPWFAWTPEALEGPAPRLAKPRWPGVSTLLVVALVWVYETASSFAVDFMLPANWRLPMLIASVPLDALAILLPAVFWLRGTFPVRDSPWLFLRHRAWAEYCWLLLAYAFLAALLALPLLVLAMQAIFVLPQQQETARALGIALPPALQLQSRLAAMSASSGIYIGATLLTALMGLSVGRWLLMRRIEEVA